MNILDATKKWVSEFNSIPQQLITKAYPNFWSEVEILATEKQCSNCGGTEFIDNQEDEQDSNSEIIKVCVSCGHDDIMAYYGLPMWGTMWTFGSNLDEGWARQNADVMSECGIWVYESDELGVFFGINGAGYDFYESHWIPLYKARGLQWHMNKE